MSELHSIHLGDPKNPTVVCLHGFLGSLKDFSRLSEVLVSSGFSVLCYDHPGHGESQHRTPPYEIADLTQDLIDLMDAKRIQQAHLVGHSMGGRVALEATLRHGDRIKSLTLLDIGLRVPPEVNAGLERLLASLPDFYASDSQLRASLSRFPVNVQRHFLLNLKQSENGGYHWKCDLRGLQETAKSAKNTDHTPLWPSIRCPRLVLRGEQSDKLTMSHFEELLALHSGTRGIVIPRAGHWVQHDNFEETSKAVRDFLREIEFRA